MVEDCVEKRFWAKVNVTDNEKDCWEFTGATAENGYGNINVDGKTTSAHRYCFFLCYGYFPVQNVNHTCDNSLCCNPLHLYDGTPKENSDDMVNRGRSTRGFIYKFYRGSARWAAKLTEEDIPKIRRMLACGYTLEYIGKVFGVSAVSISNIKRGKTWKYLARELVRKPRRAQ